MNRGLDEAVAWTCAEKADSVMGDTPAVFVDTG